ncbi:hypothetical protein GCM10011410_31500 [Hoyosella rhizosphaerae]|uniref:Uncharacterized protein n=1 Tax=Hoyosella rhizosphaerae TaxID=1755582 RepID=A0A916UJK3_9ACTN|nr:hypothetical protein GCM10011410_31500 [Hoyosella rhizosphaerae]
MFSDPRSRCSGNSPQLREQCGVANPHKYLRLGLVNHANNVHATPGLVRHTDSVSVDNTALWITHMLDGLEATLFATKFKSH